jgi:ABC-type antimicrobial peptide transport system permease subunit
VAIGATARDVVLMIMGETLALGGAGIAVGLVVAVYAVNLLADSISGIAPTDPLSFMLASAGLRVVVGVAGYLPARRASGLAPVDALRAD